jgi:CheY-like chemotaxis protein
MKALSKHIVFYIVIISGESAYDTLLRKTLHQVLPQAMVESIRTEEEALTYLTDCKAVPQLIFLDEDMLSVSGTDAVERIRQVQQLEQVPLVLLQKKTLGRHMHTQVNKAFNQVYTAPYQAGELLNIIAAVNTNWLA